jgi:hypothetical protein
LTGIHSTSVGRLVVLEGKHFFSIVKEEVNFKEKK